MKSKKRRIGGVEIVVILCVAFLSVFGCIMVYSASYYSADRLGNEYHFLIKQIIGVLLGALCLFVCTFINPEKLKRFKWLAVIVSAGLLVLVFIPGIGIENYGARRWIGLGFFSIQPSEIAKFVLVFFCAVHLSENYDRVKKFKTLISPLLVGGLFCGLVILEPNMSITMCIGLVLIIMLFLGGISFKHFACLAVPGVLAVPALIFMEPYRVKRLMAFLNPWASPQAEGFQLIQSLYGLGAGGLFGVGLFNSRQKYSFLPFAESDFIFSIIGEELGFIGAMFIVLVFVVLVACLIIIARRAKTRFGMLFVAGVASVIAVQTILNIAVVTGSIPPTGLPLPFISAGSTSLIVFMSAIGLCLNISKQSKISNIGEVTVIENKKLNKFYRGLRVK